MNGEHARDGEGQAALAPGPRTGRGRDASAEPDSRCADCGAKTLSVGPGESSEYYSVKDPVWQQAGDVPGYLCVGCLEGRLGRQLHRGDFRPGIELSDPDYPETPRYAWSYRSDG